MNGKFKRICAEAACLESPRVISAEMSVEIPAGAVEEINRLIDKMPKKITAADIEGAACMQRFKKDLWK